MDQKYLETLLQKFSNNSITRAEFDDLMAYLKSPESEFADFKQMNEVWESLGLMQREDIDASEANDLYNKIVAQTQDREPKKIVSLLNYRSILRIAAAVVIVLSAGVLIYNLNKPNNSTSLVYHEKIVPLGQRMKIVLSDTTVIWLNSGSKLRYASNYNNVKREIYLDKGEAYFEVTHNPKKPFIVHVGDVKTEVLGTAFNVEAYDHQNVSVTVARGKVKVGDLDKDLAVLTMNDRLEYKNKSARTISVKAKDLTAWTQGSLILSNKTLEEAADIIGRWYNVKIKIENSQLKNCHFTASFLNREDIIQVMNVLSELNNLKYEFNEGVITITGEGCS